MRGVLVGSLVGALVLFVWGFVYWGVLPITDDLFENTPETLTEELRTLPTTGVYNVPSMDLYDRDEAEYKRQHEEGPIAMVFLRKEGTSVGAPATFGLGFLQMLVAVLLMSFLLRSVAGAMPAFGPRVLFVLVAGAAGSFLSDIGPIVWWLHPAPMYIATFVYHIVGWALVGLVLARFVRPRPA